MRKHLIWVYAILASILLAFVSPALAKSHASWHHARHVFLVAHNTEIVKAVSETLTYNKIDYAKARHLPCDKHAFELRLIGVDEAIAMLCGSTVTDYVRDHMGEYRRYMDGGLTYGELQQQLDEARATMKARTKADDEAYKKLLGQYNGLVGDYNAQAGTVTKQATTITSYQFWSGVRFGIELLLVLALIGMIFRQRLQRAHLAFQAWRERRRAERADDDEDDEIEDAPVERTQR